MLSFERSTDYAAIRAMIVEPRVYRRVREDRMPDPSALAIPESDDAEWIFAAEDGARVALFVLVHGDELHWIFDPQVWGRTAEITRSFFEWLWANSRLTRVHGRIASYNRLSIRLAKAIGCREYGIKRKVALRNGAAFDLILFEIETP